jgi:SPX domain protein involved in polyphosphate accumulation
MKFAEHLSAHITPEWRKQYISYEVQTFKFTLCECKDNIDTKNKIVTWAPRITEEYYILGIKILKSISSMNTIDK